MNGKERRFSDEFMEQIDKAASKLSPDQAKEVLETVEEMQGGSYLGPVQTEATAEDLRNIRALARHGIIDVEIWDSSLADPENEPPPPHLRSVVDFDLYFENQSVLELYAATIHPSADAAPLVGLDNIADRLGQIVTRSGVLSLVDWAEDTGLTLMFGLGEHDFMFIAAQGWALEQWSEET